MIVSSLHTCTYQNLRSLSSSISILKKLHLLSHDGKLKSVQDSVSFRLSLQFYHEKRSTLQTPVKWWDDNFFGDIESVFLVFSNQDFVYWWEHRHCNNLISYDVFSDTIVILLTFSILCWDSLGEAECVSHSNHDRWLCFFFSRSSHLCSWRIATWRKRIKAKLQLQLWWYVEYAWHGDVWMHCEVSSVEFCGKSKN